MKTWEEEISESVVAGEREFGRLDSHQTVRHYLIPRCQEILGQTEPSPAKQGTGIVTEGDNA